MTGADVFYRKLGDVILPMLSERCKILGFSKVSGEEGVSYEQSLKCDGVPCLLSSHRVAYNPENLYADRVSDRFRYKCFVPSKTEVETGDRIVLKRGGGDDSPLEVAAVFEYPSHSELVLQNV